MPQTKAEKHPPQVSVILVTMNRRDNLRRCLESVYRQNFTEMEVIVVDNASSDGTGEFVRQEFPAARYCRTETNMGVTGGRNHGMRMAQGELCLFLDDDAVFADDRAVSRASSYFREAPELVLIAFRILKPSDRQEEYKSIPRADKKVIDGDYDCSYFCGAGFACRRSTAHAAGLFWDPLFFMTEELDLSYRLMDNGQRILRASTICVIHEEIPKARVPGKGIYFGTRNRFWVALRHLPWAYVTTHALLWWSYYFILAVKNRHPGWFLMGLRDALLGVPTVLKTRSCISHQTLGKLRQLSGRVLY
jgi:GT2 family glycosyltransferase